jgi:hypothetical protein
VPDERERRLTRPKKTFTAYLSRVARTAAPKVTTEIITIDQIQVWRDVY